MEEYRMKVRLRFFNPTLGSQPSDPDVYSRFIASKAPDAKSINEEIEAIGIDGVAERGKTVFYKDKEGNPMYHDHQIKGFFKAAAGVCYRIGKEREKEGEKYKYKLPAFKSVINQNVFTYPEWMHINIPEGEKIGELQRPLRASTAQGERVSLANSEMVPSGSECIFEVLVLQESLLPFVREWLDYGKYSGISQWRSASYGRFLYEELDADGNVIGGNMREWKNFVTE